MAFLDGFFPSGAYAASHEAMFAGNIDDCFRVGLSIKKNAINLYSQFYSSDIIVASPLGLRMIIGAKGCVVVVVVVIFNFFI